MRTCLSNQAITTGDLILEQSITGLSSPSLSRSKQRLRSNAPDVQGVLTAPQEPKRWQNPFSGCEITDRLLPARVPLSHQANVQRLPGVDVIGKAVDRLDRERQGSIQIRLCD